MGKKNNKDSIEQSKENVNKKCTYVNNAQLNILHINADQLFDELVLIVENDIYLLEIIYSGIKDIIGKK